MARKEELDNSQLDVQSIINKPKLKKFRVYMTEDYTIGDKFDIDAKDEEEARELAYGLMSEKNYHTGDAEYIDGSRECYELNELAENGKVIGTEFY